MLTIVVVTTIVFTVMSGLLEEIKQNKPFDSKEEEVFLNLQRTSVALSWAVTETLKTAELTAVQYNVLRILRGSGDGLTCKEIGERLVTKDSDVTRILERLENRNLTVRERHEKDRRAFNVRITQDGLILLESLDEPVKSIVQKQLKHLGADLLEQLNALLVLARNTVK